MKKLCLFAAIMSLLLLIGCRPMERTGVGYYFDTVVTFTIYGGEDTAVDDALLLCSRLEGLLSKTITSSDVHKLNTAMGNPVEVHDETIAVLNAALDVSEKSGGAFDITLAPVTELYDFEAENPVLPNPKDIEAALKFVDYEKVAIEGNTVILPAGMQIDLGGIAKGYIANVVRDFLLEQSVTSGIINLGGNIVVFGDKPDGSSWRVGLQDIDGETGDYMGVIELGSGSAVTSGIYERGFTVDDVRYHHIIDANTGYPSQNDLAAVTIIADDSMEADALSTACLALGLDAGMELLESYPDASGIFITKDRQIIENANNAFVKEE